MSGLDQRLSQCVLIMTITGEIKSQVDAVWNDFWSGGIANPLEVMEQLTYLLFIKGLDEAQTREEAKANQLSVRWRSVEHPAGFRSVCGGNPGC